MAFDKDAPLGGILSGYKRISTNFVVPHSNASLTSLTWQNAIGPNTGFNVNNILPQNLIIPDIATYILVEINVVIVSANAVTSNSITLTSFYDTNAINSYSSKRFAAREFVAIAPAGTAFARFASNMIIPIIGNNALIATTLVLAGAAGNGIATASLLGYWDSAEPI